MKKRRGAEDGGEDGAYCISDRDKSCQKTHCGSSVLLVKYIPPANHMRVKGQRCHPYIRRFIFLLLVIFLSFFPFILFLILASWVFFLIYQLSGSQCGSCFGIFTRDVAKMDN